MQRSLSFAVGGALTCLALAPAAAVAAPPQAHAAKSIKVSVRVQGRTRALLAPKVVRTGSKDVTKSGAPAGACPGASAAGALNVATRGRWGGTWYSSFNDYLISSILGTRQTANWYWGVWVNNRFATTGACEIKLKAGDNVLFAVDSLKKHEHPLGITASDNGTADSFTVKVVAYSDAGKAAPVSGARVRGRGISVTTNKAGKATVTVGVNHEVAVRATKKGYITTAPLGLAVTG